MKYAFIWIEFLQVLFWLPFLKPIKRIWCEEQEGFAHMWRDRGDNLFLFIFFVNCICLCVQKLEACAVNYFNKLCKLSLCSHFNNLLNFISYSTTLINSLITGRRDQRHTTTIILQYTTGTSSGITRSETHTNLAPIMNFKKMYSIYLFLQRLINKFYKLYYM